MSEDTTSESPIKALEDAVTPAPPVITEQTQTYLADPEFELRGLAWNPLCDPAMPLIGLLIRLRHLDRHADINALYRDLHNQISTIMEELNSLD